MVRRQHASSLSDTLEIQASSAEVRRAMDWLAATCSRREVPGPLAERLALCLHEALVNVINHGGEAARAAPIGVAFAVSPESDAFVASVTVSDAGRPFDPLSVPEKARPKTLDEATPGGLGLAMIRRSADRIEYRHEDGRNHFTFHARWRAQAQPK